VKIITLMASVFLFGFYLIYLEAQTLVSSASVVVNGNWNRYFEEKDINGTFILTKLNSDTLTIYNSQRAEQQYLPASTFKILNSLISLETKAIDNEHTIIKWDGKKRFYDKWNRDQNMKSAIKYSCVWFYQKLARRVGEEKMQFYLDKVQYGNSKMGASIETFWLEGDLRISAIEQIKFLEKLLEKNLPFSNSNIETVINIMMIDSTNTYKYYAKTGWAGRVDQQIGWYVGFVIKDYESWLFAMNIDIDKKEDEKYRKSISEDILKEEGIIK